MGQPSPDGRLNCRGHIATACAQRINQITVKPKAQRYFRVASWHHRSIDKGFKLSIHHRPDAVHVGQHKTTGPPHADQCTNGSKLRAGRFPAVTRTPPVCLAADGDARVSTADTRMLYTRDYPPPEYRRCYYIYLVPLALLPKPNRTARSTRQRDGVLLLRLAGGMFQGRTVAGRDAPLRPMANHPPPAPLSATDAADADAFSASSDALISTVELCARLRIGRTTLQRMHSRGEGPPVVKLSAKRIAYSTSDVAEWLRSRTQVSGTKS